MKKLSNYLIIVVVIGGILVSFWAYQKYFKEEIPELLSFSVEKGSIQEVVRVRGEVVSQKDFDLGFPFSGIVESIFVREGQQVSRGKPLIKLETTSFELKINELKSILAQKQSNLNKLITGDTKENINIYKTKVEKTKIEEGDAKANLIDKLQDAYTKSDDAIRNKVDQFFSNPRGSNPQLDFIVTSGQLEIEVESTRILVESILSKWQTSLVPLSQVSDLIKFTTKAKNNLDIVKSFLDKTSLAVNSATSNFNLSQATIDGWKSGVASARTNINNAITNLTSANEKLKTAKSDVVLAKDELALKEAGARVEDIGIAEAQIEEINNKIAITREKIKKSTLYAPAVVKTVKIWFEKREFFSPGRIAITLETSEHKIQADISELEIGKIREVDGNEVLIQLDAFPELELKGKIISIEPREIIKDGDKYYRINVFMEQHGSKIRSGMNADLTILVSSKDNVLKIPELVIYQKDDKKFVTILEEGSQKEIEIETGISNGESIEVINGLSENQTVVVSAN